MPYIIAEKPEEPLAAEASQPAEGFALLQFTATINNLTDGTLRQLSASVCGHWDSAPKFVLSSNTGMKISSSGTFTNAACGGVSYQYQGSTVPDKPTFALNYNVPSLGPNHITWHVDKGLKVKVTGDGTGFNPNLTFDITLAQ